MAVPRIYIVKDEKGKAKLNAMGELVKFTKASAEAYCRDREGYTVDSYASWNGESNV